MKILDKFFRKAGKTASDGAIENIKTAVSDFLPTIIAVGGVLITAIACSGHASHSEEAVIPAFRDLNITTNNYYYRDKEE